jgi:hypothetical protein
MNAGGSPTLNNPPALASQSPSNLGVAHANPRIPSPIPQLAASGGRPPPSLQGQSNELRFGQIGGDSNDTNVRFQHTHTHTHTPKIVLLMNLHSDRSVLCLKARWVRALRRLTFVEIPLNLHMREWDHKECHQVQEEVATQWPAEAEEGSQGSTILRWLTLKRRTFARTPRTDEACPICHIKGGNKALIQGLQALQPAAQP